LRTIDFHAHTISPAVERLVADRPQKKAELEIRLRTMGQASVEHNASVMLPQAAAPLSDLSMRFSDMDRMGVDMQVVSPLPTQYYYWADNDLARQIVDQQNEHIADICSKHPDRLVGLGTLALQHPELAVAQLDHAVKNLGLRGFELSTAVNDRELSHASLEPVWAKAEELGCVAFIHPMGCSLGERLQPAYLSNSVGQPVETAVTVTPYLRRCARPPCGAQGLCGPWRRLFAYVHRTRRSCLPCSPGRAHHGASTERLSATHFLR